MESSGAQAKPRQGPRALRYAQIRLGPGAFEDGALEDAEGPRIHRIRGPHATEVATFPTNYLAGKKFSGATSNSG